jgi:hypothetical protein
VVECRAVDKTAVLGLVVGRKGRYDLSCVLLGRFDRFAGGAIPHAPLPAQDDTSLCGFRPVRAQRLGHVVLCFFGFYGKWANATTAACFARGWSRYRLLARGALRLADLSSSSISQ